MKGGKKGRGDEHNRRETNRNPAELECYGRNGHEVHIIRRAKGHSARRQVKPNPTVKDADEAHPTG